MKNRGLSTVTLGHGSRSLWGTDSGKSTVTLGHNPVVPIILSCRCRRLPVEKRSNGAAWSAASARPQRAGRGLGPVPALPPVPPPAQSQAASAAGRCPASAAARLRPLGRTPPNRPSSPLGRPSGEARRSPTRLLQTRTRTLREK